jgi:hypothetical protein
MSRGAGRTQRAIEEVLVDHGGRLPLSTLVWEVAAREGVVGPEGLDDTIYNGIWRAAKKLRGRTTDDGAVIQRVERPILDLDELQRWCPDRTHSAAVRAMRRKLLPHVPGFLAQTGVKLKPIDTEDYVWRTSSFFHRHRDAERVRAMWPRLEEQLIRAMPSLPADARSIALGLVVRGQQKLTADAQHSSQVPFIEGVLSLLRVHEQSPLPIDLANSLLALPALLPVDEYRRKRMMAGLRQVVTLKKREPVTLTTAFKRYLLDVEGAYVRGLDGHAEAPDNMIEAIAPFDTPMKIEFATCLDDLIEHSTLKPLVWYELAAPPAR